MFKFKYISGCLLISATLIASCKKDAAFDITGDPEVKFFTNNESPGNAPVNSINFMVVNKPGVSGWENLTSTLPEIIKFPVFATRPVGETVEINAEVDNTLIATYNAVHNTAYRELPAGILNTSSLRAVIFKGQTTATDSMAIAVNHDGLGNLSEPAYMVPIKLTSLSNPALGGITSNTATQITYIVLNTELRLINYGANESDISGSLVSPRTGWVASFTPEPTTYGSIFDGSTTSFTRWGTSTTGQADINLQQEHSITGLRLLTTTTNNQRPTAVQIWLSKDGINYDQIGSALRNDIAFVGGREFIAFYRAEQAQYVRLIFSYGTSTNTQNRRINEVDIYAN